MADATPAAERQSLESFASANAACVTWSDGCIVCKRQSARDFACSTPGIACKPSALACQDPEPAKGAH